MTAFRLSKNMDKNKVFLVNKSQIEKRLDPFYYVPELMELEEKVWQKNPQKLIHYAKAVSSGATPKTTESEKYYTDKENGIPFLRVQNLTSAGRLKLDNVKFINEETHNGMLARSKVKEGDLLIKITGVGRMAVSSVAPEDFEGNVNQHMVVMKTDSPETSKILAAFLNSDIGERLASRRATGGTRPALDYPALLSIPIIYDERILKITEAAVKKKEAKEQQAKDLLASIDDYLLGELGIKVPEKDGGLKKRIFQTQFVNVSGTRLDPDYHSEYYKELERCIAASKHEIKELKHLTHFLKNGKTPASSEYSENETTEYPIIKVGSYSGDYINLDKVGYTLSSNNSTAVQIGDIFILSAAHQAEYVGKHIKLLADQPAIPTAYVGELICVRPDETCCEPMFLFSLLNLEIFKTLINREKTGQTSHVYGKDLRKIFIPAPSIEKQIEIADHIRQLREQAQQLQQEAEKELEKASREVEQLIIKE